MLCYEIDLWATIPINLALVRTIKLILLAYIWNSDISHILQDSIHSRNLKTSDLY